MHIYPYYHDILLEVKYAGEFRVLSIKHALSRYSLSLRHEKRKERFSLPLKSFTFT